MGAENGSNTEDMNLGGTHIHDLSNAGNELGNSGPHIGTGVAKVSFRDKLIEDDIPAVTFTEEARHAFNEPYKEVVIIKVLGKYVSYTAMIHRLRGIWRIKGGFHVMDAGCFGHETSKCSQQVHSTEDLVRQADIEVTAVETEATEFKAYSGDNSKDKQHVEPEPRNNDKPEPSLMKEEGWTNVSKKENRRPPSLQNSPVDIVQEKNNNIQKIDAGPNTQVPHACTALSTLVHTSPGMDYGGTESSVQVPSNTKRKSASAKSSGLKHEPPSTLGDQ
ncbi:hypothetical protein PIB30_108789, partial [Stylosanthes scabra]|nr:hypothetical protein [Stylosanthes scabra]